MAKIFVSSGHGGKDSGAVGCGRWEKDLNLQTALALRTELEKAGHTVVMSRTTDENGFSTVVNKANASKADAFIELHHNAGGGSGSEAYYYQHDSGEKPGPKMAASVCKNLSDAFGWPNRGAKKAAGNYDFKVVRETNMPAILCEVCFIDREADMVKWNAKKAASAISKGICAVFGGETEGVVLKPVPSGGEIGVGSRVKVKPGARSYDGKSIASFVYGKEYEVYQRKGDRIVLDKGGINTPFRVSDLTLVGGGVTEDKIPEPTPSPSPAPAPQTIKVGSRVKVRPGARSYEGVKMAGFVYENTYEVYQIKGNRAVLDRKGINTAFRTEDLFII